MKKATFKCKVKKDDNYADMVEHITRHMIVMDKALLVYPENQTKTDIKTETKTFVTWSNPEIGEYLEHLLGEEQQIITTYLDEPCGICLTQLTLEDKYTPLATCTHIFHPECIKKWFDLDRDNMSCPMCRETQYHEDMSDQLNDNDNDVEN